MQRADDTQIKIGSKVKVKVEREDGGYVFNDDVYGVVVEEQPVGSSFLLPSVKKWAIRLSDGTAVTRYSPEMELL